ncbi:TetR/AcrR family transcriptional regulator [Kribbella sp. NPDC004875]|uniref:TetR/AcrR family transcriptional regulator n=1 Tax=Kribbella sp. NPDC004875 TaxID=3364107 RepID=UPI0036AFB7BA
MPEEPVRRRRADAARNVDLLLDAARVVFDRVSVDAPAKEIADLAGVGVGTLYRHFPKRSDLVKAVVETGIDSIAEQGAILGATYPPGEALTRWIDEYTTFLGTKRGLAPALHSGDPAFDGLAGYFREEVGPALAKLLDAAAAAGAIRSDVTADDLMNAIAHLCTPIPGRDPSYGRRMVHLLMDGLRYRPQG